MNEEDIERWVEKIMDRLDRWFMRELITAEQYRAEVNKLNELAEEKYSSLQG